MEYWQYLLPAAGAGLLIAMVCRAVKKRTERTQRDFQRRLETLLQPRETVQVICPQKRSRCILTNQRIILEKRGDFTAFPLKSLQRIQGTNAAGNRTTVPKNMVSLTLKLDRDVTLRNTGGEFEDLAARLAALLKKRNDRKKENKTGASAGGKTGR